MVAEKGANCVITGNCGPNAYSILGAAGINVITGATGSVKEVIEKFKAGQYESSSGPNVDSHFGMKGSD
jgi:predicted Fe-Mo cluster-binding NifX family protein